MTVAQCVQLDSLVLVLDTAVQSSVFRLQSLVFPKIVCVNVLHLALIGLIIGEHRGFVYALSAY